jgi:hypothetical protein
MAAGLLYVYTDPGPDGPVSEAEYHDWYDHEHGPARMTVPGFTGARRYHAIDGQQPPWLALYETASLEVLDGPEYKALVAGGSDREKFIMSHLATLDRRVYEQVSEHLPSGAAGAAAGAAPAPAILSVGNTVPPETEDDMAAWYSREHIPMLLEVPGWRRIRRYRLTGGSGGPGWSAPDWLSLHELAGPEVLEEPAYRAAVSTPWRDRIVASALRRERRVFGFRNAFC